ncbi:unnamed protein product [Symbiodinium microadriaticum]|nr:unnamed protein product [Symbiodinium microadriaticum]
MWMSDEGHQPPGMLEECLIRLQSFVSSRRSTFNSFAGLHPWRFDYRGPWALYQALRRATKRGFRACQVRWTSTWIFRMCTFPRRKGEVAASASPRPVVQIWQPCRRVSAEGSLRQAARRKRRDVALAGRENVLDVGPVGITLPAPLLPCIEESELRSIARGGAEFCGAGDDVDHEEEEEGVEDDKGDGAADVEMLTRLMVAMVTGQRCWYRKTELQKLQEELRLQSSDLNRCRSALKKKLGSRRAKNTKAVWSLGARYRGSAYSPLAPLVPMRYLIWQVRVVLRLCQERIRTQSPTPPVNPPRRLQGKARPQSITGIMMTMTVIPRLSRVQLRMKAAEVHMLFGSSQLQYVSVVCKRFGPVRRYIHSPPQGVMLK